MSQWQPSPRRGQLYSRQTIVVPAPTSSTGRSLSLGRELESSPTRKGVGQHTMSIMDEGRTGMKVCCQEKGYSRATTAWEQLDRVLGREEQQVSKGFLGSQHLPSTGKLLKYKCPRCCLSGTRVSRQALVPFQSLPSLCCAVWQLTAHLKPKVQN